MKDCYTMPVPGDDMPPLSSNINLQYVTEVQDAAGEIISSIHALIQSSLVEPLNTCQATLQECTAKCSGQIGLIQDQASAILAKCHQKASDACTSRVGLAYGYGSAAGVPIPTLEQAVYGLQTGDYLGSCGLQPISCPTPPDLIETISVQSIPSRAATVAEAVAESPQLLPEFSPRTVTRPVMPPVGVNGQIPGELLPEPAELIPGPGMPGYLRPEAAPCPPRPTEPLIDLNTWPPSISAAWLAYYASIADGSFPAACLTPFEEQVRRAAQTGPQEVPGTGRQPPPPRVTQEGNYFAAPKFDVTTPPDWSVESVCKMLAEWLRQLRDEETPLKQLMGWYTLPNGDKVWPTWVPDEVKDLPFYGDDILHFLGSVVWDLLDTLAGVIPTAANCNGRAVRVLALILAVGDVIQRFTGLQLARFLQPYRNALNLSCPTDIPSSVDSRLAWLNGLIDEATLRCLVAANNDIPEWQVKFAYGMRTRPNAEQATVLYRRGYIDRTEWFQRMRENGVLNDFDYNRYQQMTDVWPGISDVIRFMVRDVGDDELKRKFGLEKDFEKKWDGELKEIGEKIGIKEPLARMYWAAHWYLPSPTQLYHMLHRLRPGRVPKELVVEKDDVKTALLQNDMLPFWVDKEVAISFNPMTRTDLQRAFQIRAIKDKDLEEGYRDLGYDDTAVGLLMKFQKELRRQRDITRLGLSGPKQWAQAFRTFTMTEQDYAQRLAGVGIQGADAQLIVNDVKADRKRRAKREAISSIRKRFLSGEIDAGQIAPALSAAGMDQDQIIELKQLWQFQVFRRPKEATAAQLCRWRDLRIIEPAEQLIRLTRMGWSMTDAQRIVAACNEDIGQWAMKKAEAAAKKVERALRVLQKALEDEGKTEQAAALTGPLIQAALT